MCWPVSLAELVSSRFSEKTFLKNKLEMQLRKTADINFWPLHIQAWVREPSCIHRTHGGGVCGGVRCI